MDILIATNNPGKYREITAVLSEADDSAHPKVRWHGLADLNRSIDEPHEDGETFLANAVLKATCYSRAASMWALADDSGLEVDALGGEPGVHSAYFDRSAADRPREERDRANNAKLIASLRNVPPERRTGRYRCVLVLADGDRILATAEGVVEGRIIDTPRGGGGFGYDPYFLVPELGRTVAELPPDEKNRISHRGQALRIMRKLLHDLLSAV